MRWLLLAFAAVLIAAGALRPERRASAGLARTVFPISATATIHTETADYLIVLTGWTEIGRSVPGGEDGIEVTPLSVPNLHLQGASPLGLLVVTPQPPDSGHVSTGEVRATSFGSVVSSFLDLYVDVAAPNTNIGLVTFRNDQALHMVPWNPAHGIPVNTWPGLGVTYHLTSGCIPLISQNPDLTLNACVSALDISIAPTEISYTVGRDGPAHLHPASIYGLTPSAVSTTTQAPFLRIPCASLGLTPDGCDDGTDGTQDAIDALSYGRDFGGGGTRRVYFSVAPGAQGVPGSAVQQQVECPPAAPGLAPEPDADVFSATNFHGNNALVFDGNGPIGTCPPGFPLGLVEAATVRDNVDGIDLADASEIDGDGDGVPDLPVYFSLDSASPSLAAYGFGPADILMSVAGGPPTAYRGAAELGLQSGDDIDGLCLGRDKIYFSLTPASPTLSRIGAGPGDILAPGPPILTLDEPRGAAPIAAPPVIVRSAASLGLLPGDNVDALACPVAFSHPSNGDVNCDGRTDATDAALVLQFEAGLLRDLPCFDEADVNDNNWVNSLDAFLILQFATGLIPHLPP